MSLPSTDIVLVVDCPLEGSTFNFRQLMDGALVATVAIEFPYLMLRFRKHVMAQGYAVAYVPAFPKWDEKWAKLPPEPDLTWYTVGDGEEPGWTEANCLFRDGQQRAAITLAKAWEPLIFSFPRFEATPDQPSLPSTYLTLTVDDQLDEGDWVIRLAPHGMVVAQVDGERPALLSLVVSALRLKGYRVTQSRHEKVLSEASLTHFTFRSAEDESFTDVECRFSDGQKYAAIKVLSTWEGTLKELLK